MKLNQLLEASHTNQPDVRVIARWLDSGMDHQGIFDSWNVLISNWKADEIYDGPELWAIIDEWNTCIQFIEQTLTVSNGNVISDERAERVIGQPRS